MYALGIPNRQYRRCTQVLGHESANPINYQVEKQEDGFYLFTFPEADEYDFRDIVNLLKKNGITTIGADTQLTEKHIMKLTDLLKEQEESGMDAIAVGADDARDMMEEKSTTMKNRLLELAGLRPLYEQGFDDRLKAAGGFSDEEFDDITSTDPNPFMDDDDPRSPGEELADRTIADFRKKYRGMSDDDLDDFSAKMVEHLLDNIAAQARAKVIFAKKGI